MNSLSCNHDHHDGHDYMTGCSWPAANDHGQLGQILIGRYLLEALTSDNSDNH